MLRMTSRGKVSPYKRAMGKEIRIAQCCEICGRDCEVGIAIAGEKAARASAKPAPRPLARPAKAAPKPRGSEEVCRTLKPTPPLNDYLRLLPGLMPDLRGRHEPKAEIVKPLR